MLRQGTRVTKLTKKVGATAPTGRIVGVRPHAYEVEWDDGHVSLITQSAVVAVKNNKRKAG